MPLSPLVFALLLGVLAAAGCEPKPYVKEDRTDYRPRRPELTHAADGAYRTCEVLDDSRLVVARGSTLTQIDAATGAAQGQVALGAPGEAGEISSIAVNRDAAGAPSSLWVCREGVEVVRVEVGSGSGSLQAIQRFSDKDLGGATSWIAEVGGRVIAGGPSGAIDVQTNEWISSPGRPAAHALLLNGAPAVISNGELVQAGRHVASATSAMALPPGVGPRAGAVAFRQTDQGARIVLLDSAGSEVATATVPGRIERLRIVGDRLFAITPAAIQSWRVDNTALSMPQRFPVKGALDLCEAAQGDLFVCGSFGRALYHPYSDSRGPGDTFFAIERAPGRLEVAAGDGRRVLAGSAEGVWLYKTGTECEMTTRPLPKDAVRTEEAACGEWGHAVLRRSGDGDQVVVTRSGIPDEVLQYALVSEIEGEGNALWIAHENSIDVFMPSLGGGPLERIGSFTFGSPVTHLFPENTGGMAYVTLFSGMGAIEWVPYGPPVPVPAPGAPARDSR